MSDGASDDRSDGQIILRVPAGSAFAELIRVAAAQLMAQSDHSYDVIEDARIAVNEAVRMVDGPQGSLEARFTNIGRSLTLRVRLEDAEPTARHSAESIGILEATTEAFSVEPPGEPVARAVTLNFGSPPNRM